MLESAMELPNKNDLLGILLASICQTRNNSDSQIVDAHGVQSETGDDVSNGYPLPFHEILGQKIINLKAHDMRNPEKASHPEPKLNTAELFQEDSEGMDLSALQQTPMSDRSQGNGKNSNIHSSFTQKSEEGSGQDTSGNQISNTILSVSILPETFLKYPQTNIQNADQNLSLWQDVADVNARFGIEISFLNNSNGEDSSLFPQTRGQTGGADTTKNEVFVDANISGILYNGETSLIHNQNVGNTLTRSDIFKSNPTQKPEQLQKMDMSIFNTMQESEITDSDRNAINMMKLPSAFKMLAQNVSTENMADTLMTEIDNPADIAERHSENDGSKTTNEVSPQDGILNTSQTNEEWDLFDRSESKQKTSEIAAHGTDIERTNSKVPFSLDNQMTKDDAQANSPDFQQKTAIFPGSDITPSSFPEGRNNNVSHTFHGSSPTEIKHTYSSIIEQFFKEIRLVNHGDKISLVNYGGRSEIKLNLTPPELGNVEIHFTEENDEIEAKIFVENAEVKAAIEDNVHRLKESVAASGLEIQKIEVYIQNDNASKEKSFNNSDAHNQPYQTRGQEWMNGDHSIDEDSIGNDVQKEISVKTSNVMVDYII